MKNSAETALTQKFYLIHLRKLPIIIPMLFLAPTFFQCMKKKPLDPLDREPHIEIIAPALDKTNTITADSLRVTLRGDNEYSLFRYRLDNTAWSEFVKEPEIFFTMLDDGSHTLYIESMYEGHSFVARDSLYFNVQALASSAVYVVPQKVILCDTCLTASLKVEVKNLSACDRLHFVFSGAKIDSIYRKGMTDSVLVLSNNTVADVIRFPGTGTFSGISTVLTVRARATAGKDTTRLAVACTARDTNNVDVKIERIRGCVILKK